MTMRVLWLNTHLLLPLDKGGKLRTWHLMRHLAASHHITSIAFDDPDGAEANRRGMSEVCAKLVMVPRRERPKEGARFYAGVARHLFDPLPYAVAQYRSAAYRQAVTAELSTGRYDRVVCDFLVPAVNLPSRLPCASVLFTHNVEAEIWRRHADTAASLLHRTLYRQQWRRMRRFERRTLARFDRVLAVSDADRDTFARLYPGALDAPATVIPTGVDTGYFAPAPASGHGLVFTGSMDWLPNVDGVLHFCRDILPLVRRQLPGVTFTIVGRAPTPAVRRLADQPGVSVTGRVDDVRPYLASAAAYVVPLRIGGGTRLKIFEAMAAGRAVVSTSIGAEGLPAEPGRHLLLADDPAGFAASVVALLTRPALRSALEHEARALVASGYDWRHAAAHLERAILDTTPRIAPARAALPWPPIKRTTHP
jgi:sugar transferase (PEP-CTERM/EpsH1 system associated)